MQFFQNQDLFYGWGTMLIKNNRIPKLLKFPIIGLKSKIIKIDLPIPSSSTNCQISVHLQDYLSAHPGNTLLPPSPPLTFSCLLYAFWNGLKNTWSLHCTNHTSVHCFAPTYSSGSQNHTTHSVVYSIASTWQVLKICCMKEVLDKSLSTDDSSHQN